MGDIKHDISHDMIDRGEDVGMMEPTLLAEGSGFRRDLTDLALELVSPSAGFVGAYLGESSVGWRILSVR